MAQQTAAQFIKRAYYLSQVKDPGEAIEGYEATFGLDTLNGIIEEWGGLSIYIPTYTTLEIDVLPNVFQYDVVPPITQLLEANLLDENNVLTILNQIFLKRQNTLDYPLGAESPTRPDSIFINNNTENLEAGKTVVWLFPPPAENYLATLQVKQTLLPVLYDDTLINIPLSSSNALLFQLALDLSIEFGSVLSEKFDMRYKTLMKQLRAANKRDMSVKSRNIFTNRYMRFRAYNSYYG